VTHVSKNVLESIGELKGFDVSKSVLHMRIYNQLEQAKDFTAKMESITESTFLPFFRSQGLDWFQVKIVVKMKVV
jgi:hypothetical protein